ncbi:ROK family glucokinase [Salirhabdus sp. Marseille-P4669]|uniref:ROK family glucokinase n=1 Tax=Salirhabdus sp. Marseille-P4669 TaxID=2042310 RepID=UPI000C7A024C|nr:ROK family glucokinase [Salirhabdus sp. Marseille-P4669]
MAYYVGADIGGTTVKLAFITEKGQIVHKWEISTNIHNNGEEIPKEIVYSIETKMQELRIPKEELLGLGAGAPGYVNTNTGLVYEAVNVGWKNFNLKDKLSQRLQIPVYVTNDANLAALGEYWVGAGRNIDHLITVTLGTGVGGGIVVNGQVVNGIDGSGGEIGHVVVTPNDGPTCNCGRRGCIETYASATGIARQGLEEVVKPVDTSLKNIFATTGTLTAKDIFEQAKDGDLVSKQIVENTTNLLGIMLANLATIINPGVIIIGGGVSKAKDTLLNPLKRAFEKYCLDHAFHNCEITIAQLGNDAGVVGAAYYVKQHMNKK